MRSVNNANKSKRHPTYVRYVGEVEGTGLSELEGRDRRRTLGLVSAPSPGGRAAGADVEQVASDVALGLVRVVVADAKHCGICGVYHAGQVWSRWWLCLLCVSSSLHAVLSAFCGYVRTCTYTAHHDIMT